MDDVILPLVLTSKYLVSLLNLVVVMLTLWYVKTIFMQGFTVIICALQVEFGEYLNYTCADGIDGTGIQIQYEEPVGDDGKNNLLIYIPIAVGAVILIIIVLFILILCVVVQVRYRKEKQSEKLFADLQMQLEEMESGLADECKAGKNLSYYL